MRLSLVQHNILQPSFLLILDFAVCKFNFHRFICTYQRKKFFFLNKINIIMADESFYGVTLTGTNNAVLWDLLSNDEEYPRGQKLVIKQVLLGAEAKADEFNVVEVQINNGLKIPIAVLKAGETRAVNPDIEFFETAVTFKLTKGNGPVYIHGQNIKDDVVDIEDEDTEDEDGIPDADEDDEGEEKPKPKKAKLENNIDGKNSKPNKKK